MSAAQYRYDGLQQSAKVECRVQRLYDSPRLAPWLLTLSVPCTEERWNGRLFLNSYPQCRAVVDDFGTLVPVAAWQ